MTEFQPRISDVGNDHFTNCATTTASFVEKGSQDWQVNGRPLSHYKPWHEPVGNSELAVPHRPREVWICEGKDGLDIAGVKPIRSFLQNPPKH